MSRLEARAAAAATDPDALHALFGQSIGETHELLATECDHDIPERRQELRELALVHAVVALAAATMAQQRPTLPRPGVPR